MPRHVAPSVVVMPKKEPWSPNVKVVYADEKEDGKRKFHVWGVAYGFLMGNVEKDEKENLSVEVPGNEKRVFKKYIFKNPYIVLDVHDVAPLFQRYVRELLSDQYHKFARDSREMEVLFSGPQAISSGGTPVAASDSNSLLTVPMPAEDFEESASLDISAVRKKEGTSFFSPDGERAEKTKNFYWALLKAYSIAELIDRGGPRYWEHRVFRRGSEFNRFFLER